MDPVMSTLRGGTIVFRSPDTTVEAYTFAEKTENLRSTVPFPLFQTLRRSRHRRLVAVAENIREVV